MIAIDELASVRVALSDHEQQAVFFLVNGYGTAEMAKRLGRTEQQVDAVLSGVYRKVRVRNRVDLAALYLLKRRAGSFSTWE